MDATQTSTRQDRKAMLRFLAFASPLLGVAAFVVLGTQTPIKQCAKAHLAGFIATFEPPRFGPRSLAPPMARRQTNTTNDPMKDPAGDWRRISDAPILAADADAPLGDLSADEVSPTNVAPHEKTLSGPSPAETLAETDKAQEQSAERQETHVASAAADTTSRHDAAPQLERLPTADMLADNRPAPRDSHPVFAQTYPQTSLALATHEEEKLDRDYTDDLLDDISQDPAQDAGENAADGQDQADAGGGDKLGEAPEDNTLQFLRRQSILLDPGKYEIDYTFQYVNDESDFAVAEVRNNQLFIGEAQRRSRLLMVPIELRVGLTPVTQAFVNVPFGWANSELTFLNEDEFSNVGGIGDVSAGLIEQLIEGTESFPDVLGTLAFSAPSGRANFLSSLTIPGSSIGQGFWTVTGALTAIQTYDPIVLFGSVGYTHRFEAEFDNGVLVNPGKIIFYRLGMGFAVNNRVTMSATFNGAYITEDYVNGNRLAGSIREPMSIRLASTIAAKKTDKSKQKKTLKNIEPFVQFGITGDAIDTLLGISFTK